MRQFITALVIMFPVLSSSLAPATVGWASPLGNRGANPPFVVEKDGDVWRVWQGGVLRWRAQNPGPEVYGFFSEEECSLVLIASWGCPGNVFTGGQLHRWDLNANGVLDLSYSNWAYDAYVYEAVGDDQFQQMYQYPCPVGSYNTKLVCTGDGDSDDLAEMVFASGTSGVPRDLFFVESPEIGAYPDQVVLVLPEQNIGVNHMRMADLDGDGRREYIGSTQGTHDMLLAIWESTGDNSYTQVFATHFSAPPWSVSGEIAVGDFDGDGRGDLVAPDNGDSSMIHILEAVGDDLYEEVWSAAVPTQNVYWVTPGPDLDRDGRGDFVVTGGEGWVTVLWSFLMYESTGDDSYELVWSHQVVGPMIDGGSATGDIDGDGEPELLCQTADRTLLFRAIGDNQLELCWQHQGPVVGQGEHRLIAPDLDGDCRGEAIWWIESEPGVLVLYEQPGLLSLQCQALTPIFCRGESFYFRLTVNNNTGGEVSGFLTFSGYSGYDCEPGNILVAIPRNRSYPPGITETSYFFKVPSVVQPGQYSASVGGDLSGNQVDCCMDADIVPCSPWRPGDNTGWELGQTDRPPVEETLPMVTSLSHNYPNPFNARTIISYQLANDSRVRLEVYNLIGQQLATLVDAEEEAGYRSVSWDASELSSGIYYYSLTAGDLTETKMMMLVK